jgi:subtilisin family serine protease
MRMEPRARSGFRAASSARTGALLVGPDHPALEGRTGRGVRVTVVDSGVNPGHPHVGGLAGARALDDRGRPHPDPLDRLGHGTAVTAAIHERAPGAEIQVLKVFHDTLSTTILTLLEALGQAVDDGARIVNLSLGTVRAEHAPLLEELVGRARDAGTLLVSARGADGNEWYPGVLPGSVGVELDWSCPREALRVGGGGTFLASGYPRPIPGVHPERNLKGVSFAVANVSGILARLLEGRPEVGRVEEVLGLFVE